MKFILILPCHGANSIFQLSFSFARRLPHSSKTCEAIYMPRITILLLGIPSITEIIELEEVMDFLSVLLQFGRKLLIVKNTII